MKKELIGYVAVDSGQLLLCDPCYIDSQWEKEDFEDIRIYKSKSTGDVLQYCVDFNSYADIIPSKGKSMNELLATGDWEQIDSDIEPKNPFSYNACARATLSDKGHGQLMFKMGNAGAGVAFSTAFGDGMYPVWANYNFDKTLRSVEVVFEYSDDDDEDWDDDSEG